MCCCPSKQVTCAGGALWCIIDFAGVTCVTIGYCVIFGCDYIVGSHILLPWTTLSAFMRWVIYLVYNVVVALAVWSHLACMMTDPGAVPLNGPEEEELDMICGDVDTGRHVSKDVEGCGSQNSSEDENINQGVISSSKGYAPVGQQQQQQPQVPGQYIAQTGVQAQIMTYDQTSSARQIIKSNGVAVNDFVKVCKKCHVKKPPRAHHCSTCNRCIVKMDHHCPWVNNCVGQMNQKHFMLYIFYINVMSWSALCLMTARVWSCWSSSGETPTMHVDEDGHLAPVPNNNKFMNRNRERQIYRSLTEGRLNLHGMPDHCEPDDFSIIGGMILLFMGLTFALFTCAMGCDQVSAVMSDQTFIEKLQARREGLAESDFRKRIKRRLVTRALAETFGTKGGFTWQWFLPLRIKPGSKS